MIRDNKRNVSLLIPYCIRSMDNLTNRDSSNKSNSEVSQSSEEK